MWNVRLTTLLSSILCVCGMIYFEYVWWSQLFGVMAVHQLLMMFTRKVEPTFVLFVAAVVVAFPLIWILGQFDLLPNWSRISTDDFFPKIVVLYLVSAVFAAFANQPS